MKKKNIYRFISLTTAMVLLFSAVPAEADEVISSSYETAAEETIIIPEDPEDSTSDADTQDTENDAVQDTEADRTEIEEDGTDSDAAAAKSGSTENAADTEEDISEDSAEAAKAAEERMTDPEELGYIPGSIVVVYQSDSEESSLDETAEKLGGEVQEEITDSENGNIALVSISDDTTVAAAVDEYEADPMVICAEPDYIFDACEEAYDESDDPDLSKQYYLYDKSVTGYAGTNSAAAWELVKGVQYEKVTVAVVDTGCSLEHDDLKNIVDRDKSVKITDSGYIPLEGDYEGSSEPAYHGTRVTGVIAAEAGNGTGIAGLASLGTNDMLDLVDVAIFNDDGITSLSSIIKGLEYSREIGADVINLSVGAKTNTKMESLESLCQTLYNEGILVVCAAGNYGSTQTVVPADYTSTLSVINVTKNGTRSSSSSYGENKDICAPGVDIYTTYGENTYTTTKGTSFSAPEVAAAAAMLYAVDPDMTAELAKNILISTAVDLGTEGFDIYTANGLVNAYAAVKKALGLPSAGSVSLDYKSKKEGTITVTVSGAENAGDPYALYADIYTKDDKSDAISLTLEESAGGSLSADLDLALFDYAGTVYHAEVYYYFGGEKVAIGSDTLSSWTTSKGFTAEGINNNTEYLLTLESLKVPGGAADVRALVWSAAGGKDDKKVYHLTGTYGKDYTVTVPIVNHKEAGTYYAKIFVVFKNGTKRFYKTKTFTVERSQETLPDVTVTKINNGSRFVITMQYYMGSGTPKAAIWSRVGGTDDRKRYTFTLQKNGSYSLTVNAADFVGTGIFTVKTYDAYQTLRTVTFEVSGGTGSSVTITGKNKTAGTADFSVIPNKAYKKIKVFVWCASDKSDLKCYMAKADSDGIYRISVDKIYHSSYNGVYYYKVFGCVGSTKTLIKSSSVKL